MPSLDEYPATSLFLRRQSNGGCLILGMLKQCPLPDGVNAAVVKTQLILEDFRDETETTKGQSYMDIFENGWKSVAPST